MTALRFQTGGRHQTSPASLRGFGGTNKSNTMTDSIAPNITRAKNYKVLYNTTTDKKKTGEKN